MTSSSKGHWEYGLINYRHFGTDPPVSENWVETEIAGEWVAAIRFVDQGGDPVIAELRVFPLEGIRSTRRKVEEGEVPPGRWAAIDSQPSDLPVPDSGLRAEHLREISLATLRSAARGLVSQVSRHPGDDWSTEEIFSLFHDAGLSPITRMQLPRQGREASDYFYATVAFLYWLGALSGNRPNVWAATTMREMGYSEASSKKVSGWVETARRKSLLTRPFQGTPAATEGRGHVGGNLTPKALELLELETPNTEDPSSQEASTDPKPSRTSEET